MFSFKTNSPLSALSMPPIIFNKVDFPDPEGPKIVTIFPFSISKFISLSTQNSLPVILNFYLYF